MRSKLKIAAIVAIVVIGMVVYKGRFDEEQRREAAKEKKPAPRKERWN